MDGSGSRTGVRWSVAECDLPWRPNWSEVARLLVDRAIRAPSSLNTQPWQFRVCADWIEVRVDRERRLEVADHDGRAQYLSVGCALENLLIAAEHFGLGHDVEWFPAAGDLTYVAKVRLWEGGTGSPFRRSELFDAIAERRTNHRRFEPRAVSPEALQRLAACVVEPAVRVHVLEKPELRDRLAELVSRSEIEEFGDRSFRRELATWVGSGALGMTPPVARLAALALRHGRMGPRLAARDGEAVRQAPVLIALTVEQNDRMSQVRTGMVLERMWLEATCMGLAIQPMSAPLHSPHGTRELAGLLGTPERTPMHMIRVGWAVPEHHRRPRRPVSEVLRIG